MIKFFRNIRQNMLMENPISAKASTGTKTSKYITYAIGEIILVVIGILIALSINNWNEERKERQIELKAYGDLLSTLKKDQKELSEILEFQKASSEMQQRLISTSISEIKKIDSVDSLNIIIFKIYDGARSFFPKYGTYNSIVSNKGIDIIKSETIKSKLIDLYDYQCTRYQFVDKALDEKYMNDYIPFVQREIGFYLNTDLSFQKLDVIQFYNHYEELQLECKNLGPMTRNALMLLMNINASVNALIIEIENELANKKQ